MQLLYVPHMHLVLAHSTNIYTLALANGSAQMTWNYMIQWHFHALTHHSLTHAQTLISIQKHACTLYPINTSKHSHRFMLLHVTWRDLSTITRIFTRLLQCMSLIRVILRQEAKGNLSPNRLLLLFCFGQQQWGGVGRQIGGGLFISAGRTGAWLWLQVFIPAQCIWLTSHLPWDTNCRLVVRMSVLSTCLYSIWFCSQYAGWARFDSWHWLAQWSGFHHFGPY